jgi:hypothetical protein
MMAPVGGRRRRAPVATFLVLGLLVASVYGLYNFLFRPGKLAVEVVPQDAEVRVDNEVVKGPPYHIQKGPGSYNLSFHKDGYSKYEQTVEIRAGESERIRVHLEPSADTGFELTSDPPGQLVWLDGQPFTGSDPAGPQARTDFKATRVPPGRHVLEIRGDPRFKAWRHEFFQEPGRILVIPATLDPVGSSGSVSTIPRPQQKPPEPAPAPPSPAPPATASGTTPPATTGSAGSTGSIGSTTPTTAPKPPAPQPPKPTTASTPPKPTGPAIEPTTPPAPAVTTETPAPAPRPASCTVTIGSKPWSEVWIDGRNTGKLTPLMDHRVPCGRRKITLKNPDLQIEKTETINVRSGEKFKKVFQLLDEEG